MPHQILPVPFGRTLHRRLWPSRRVAL